MTERVRLEITGLAHGGEGLGRREERVIFVPFSAPGDLVVAQIVQEGRGWARGRLLEVVRPSADRVAPPCPHFGVCGGCQLQHIAYPAQLRAKHEVFRDQLGRLSRLRGVSVQPVKGMVEPWHYRNMAYLYPTPTGELGIKAGGHRYPAAVDSCPLFHPLIDELFTALELDIEGIRRIGLRAGVRTGDQMVILEIYGDEAPELEVDMPISIVLARQNGDIQVLAGDQAIWEEVAGRRLRISATSVFPANTDMAEQMTQHIQRALALSGNEKVVDAGCGVGLFSLTLGTLAGLIGIDDNPWAVADFLDNARGAPWVGAIEATLSAGLAEINDAVDVAIAHPPRAGLGENGAQELARLKPRRLIYLADDPAVLARDADGLLEAGYRLVEVQPFDLLPQTYQTPAIALWER